MTTFQAGPPKVRPSSNKRPRCIVLNLKRRRPKKHQDSKPTVGIVAQARNLWHR